MQIRVWDDDYSEEFDIHPEDDSAAFAKQVWNYGNWGEGNYRVEYQWEVTNDDGDTIDSGSGFIEHQIEEPTCLESADGEHDWTSEFEGGCTENPGVWSLGGTTMSFSCHCRHCGMEKTEVNYGSQRNPGQCDTVEYSEPDPEWVDAHIHWD